MKAPPKKAESTMLRLILPDFLVLFLILAVVANAAVIYSEIVKFPQVLLLVPAISILAIIIAFVRFYKYLSNVLRVMGALSFIYEELGGGTSAVKIDFPKPILLFGFLSKKAFAHSPAKQFNFQMKSDSSKYQAEITIAIDHDYRLDMKITDWRHQTHSRSACGKIPQLQHAIIGVIDDVRKSVLESKGVQVQSIVTEKEAYRPETVPAKTVVPKAVPTPVKKPVAKPAPLLPPVLEKKAVEEKEKEIKAELGKATKEKEKKALQDILYQLEEINKVIKSD